MKTSGVICIALILVHSSISLGTPQYVMNDLGPLPAGFVSATGKGLDINSSLRVAGSTALGTPLPLQAATATPNGSIVPLGGLSGGYAIATAINEDGIVTGYGGMDDNVIHAFVGDTSGLFDIGTLGTDSSAFAINNNGHATGESTLDTGERRAFYWNGESMLDLGTLGINDLSIGRGISDSGMVTGLSGTQGGDYQAVLWSGESIIPLGTLGGARSVGNDVSDNGFVTGSSYLADGSHPHAFLWDGDEMLNLSEFLPPGWKSNGKAVNSMGWATGWAGAKAFVWDGTEMILLPGEGQGWWISDDGATVLGRRGVNIASWTLVPEPPTSLLAAFGILGLFGCRCRCRIDDRWNLDAVNELD